MKGASYFALAGLLALAACAGLPTHLETPEVSFVGVQAVEASLFEQKLTVRLKVRNPNEMELPVNGLDVDLEVAGEPFAHGVSAREFVVPAGGEAEFDMNVTANAMNALLRIAGEGKSDVIEYRLKGKLSTKVGMLRTIPFDERGSVSAADLLGKGRGRR